MAQRHPRIVAVASVYSFSPLVEHFVDWYSRPPLDVDQILLCVTDRTRDAVAAVKNDRCLLHVVPEIPDDPAGYDAYKDRAEKEAWEKLRFTRDDYKLPVDIDEFQAYPWDLRSIVNDLVTRNEWAMGGILVDRFAARYSTPPIRPLCEADLASQFPISRQWPVHDWPERRDQTTPWGACFIKVVICKGAVELAAGRHHPINAVMARHPQFGFFLTDLKVNHYRWANGVVEVMNARAQDTRFTERYRKECVAAGRWLAEQQKAKSGR